MADVDEQSGGVATGDQPHEQELRAAYEAELNRITSSEMILQMAVSLINIGGRRLGLTAPSGSPADSSPAAPERDLEQVRDAIDATRALLPILERSMPRELGPLRDAIAQLQMAYAREAQSGAGAGSTAAPPPAAEQAKPAAEQAKPAAEQAKPAAEQAKPAAEQAKPAAEQAKPIDGERQPGPGPAQASGRLWVPGR